MQSPERSNRVLPDGPTSSTSTFRRSQRRSVEVCRATSSKRFSPRGASGERRTREQRARSVAEELTRAGTRIRFDRSIHVPEDEICFFVFDAPSSREAALVAEQAALDPIRVVEAISSGEEQQ